MSYIVQQVYWHDSGIAFIGTTLFAGMTMKSSEENHDRRNIMMDCNATG